MEDSQISKEFSPSLGVGIAQTILHCKNVLHYETFSKGLELDRCFEVTQMTLEKHENLCLEC
jgi:hypothetical protein